MLSHTRWTSHKQMKWINRQASKQTNTTITLTTCPRQTSIYLMIGSEYKREETEKC